MALSNPSDPNPVPQFAKVEYAAKPGAEKCVTCKSAVGSRYYRVNGALNCETCAEIARRQLPADSHAKFIRGLLFGVGAAILGLILYSTFAIVTGLVIGYVALAVGYIVGKAIHIGSQGNGGRRYQIAAVLLTYAAVSLSAIPIAISQSAKSHAPQNHSAAADDDSDSTASSNSSPEKGTRTSRHRIRSNRSTAAGQQKLSSRPWVPGVVRSGLSVLRTSGADSWRHRIADSVGGHSHRLALNCRFEFAGSRTI